MFMCFQKAYGGGGSGGSTYIQVTENGVLTGPISANGGAGYSRGGGGAGGRINAILQDGSFISGKLYAAGAWWIYIICD